MDSHMSQKFHQAMEQVDSVIVGKKEQVEKMFIALLARGHVLLDDTPGMGKTTMARALAAVLGMSLKRIQFTSDLMPSDITGVNSLVHSNTSSTQAPYLQFQPGPVFTNILLADEVNRASPRTQSALLEAMAEKQVTVDGTSHALPNPFWVVATQNPIDLSGTFPLPDSQMDRFLFRMNMGYPSEQDEVNLIMGQGGNTQTLSPVLHIQDVLSSQHEVDQVLVAENLARYIHRLVHATRRHGGVTTGVSPRGALALLASARADAWLQSQVFVQPENVQKVFVDCVAHRLNTVHLDYTQKQKIAQEILHNTSV